MKYQEFCRHQLKAMLDCKLTEDDFNKSCYKYAIKSLIGVYSETYEFDNSEIKFWDLDFHSRRFRGKKVWMNLLASSEAACICETNENGISGTKANNQAPYYEHLEPKGVTYLKLIELIGLSKQNTITAADIQKILDNCKLLILAPTQKDYLDTEAFTQQDIDAIESWKKNEWIPTATADNAIASISTGTSCKSSGNAYARFAHLITAHPDLQFQWGNNSASANNPQGVVDLFHRYMCDKDYKIK